MSRALRIEFAGAVYHVISRGNSRAAVFLGDADRHAFLDQLGRVSERLGWRLLSYCLMDNHYHLLLETPEPTLARGMRDLNGGYALRFNREHDHVGHVFQGRYRAILVERGSYLLELIRYVVLNPVRAGLCSRPEDWPWSSHASVLRDTAASPALDCRAVLGHFGPEAAAACEAYERFVLAGIGLPRPAPGADAWTFPVAGSLDFRTWAVGHLPEQTIEVPRPQRASRQLAQYEAETSSRDEAVRAAYASGHYSLVAIGRHFGLHYSTVGKICAARPKRRAARTGYAPTADTDR